MPASRPYRVGLYERLKSSEYAAAYLNAAEREGVFLEALRNVAEVHKISNVAEKAGVNRESLYRTLSAQGNPTLTTLDSILDVLGLARQTVPKAAAATIEPTPHIPRYSPRSYRLHRRRSKKRRHEVANQLRFAFPRNELESRDLPTPNRPGIIQQAKFLDEIAGVYAISQLAVPSLIGGSIFGETKIIPLDWSRSTGMTLTQVNQLEPAQEQSDLPRFFVPHSPTIGVIGELHA